MGVDRSIAAARMLRLCVVLGDAAGDPDDPEAPFSVALASGATSVRVTPSAPRLRGAATRGAAQAGLARERGVALLVDDDVSATVALRADGIRLGRSGDVRHARQALGKRVLVGVAVSSLVEAVTAAAEGADYLEAGPVFDGPSPIGLDELAAICAGVDPPVLAYGGIRPDEVSHVLKAGAVGVAVGGEVIHAEDMEWACLSFRAAVDRASSTRA